MGYNTPVLILNDAVHLLPKDPDLGKKLAAACLNSRGVTVPVVNHVNAITVLPAQHADTVQVLAFGGNYVRRLGYAHWQDDETQILKRVAEQMGYRLVRKPST
jgi:hypothetical protein